MTPFFWLSESTLSLHAIMHLSQIVPRLSPHNRPAPLAPPPRSWLPHSHTPPQTSLQFNQLQRPCAPWSSLVCFVTLCSLFESSHPHFYVTAFSHHASFISFMIFSSFILSSILEMSISQPFLRVSTLGMFVSFSYIYSPVVDTNKQSTSLLVPVSVVPSSPRCQLHR